MLEIYRKGDPSPCFSPPNLAFMDTFFISHGSPTLSIDKTLPARHFLESWQDKILPIKPKAILVISGHWETEYPTVNYVERNDTIYDFYGFPKPMYEIKYPAPGAPDLANKVKELLMQSGFKHVDIDNKRGLDHGAWVPLMLMYPSADIPVCQLSLQTQMGPYYHYNIGKALAPLRDEGVLIIGSGSATHNLSYLNRDNSTPLPWATQFDSWLRETLISGRHDNINDYEKKAPCAKIAHPWPEHLYPLHVALGASGENAKAELIHESWSNGSLSYSSFRFSTAP